MAAVLGKIEDFVYTSSGQSVRAHVYCDTVLDLPTVNQFSGYTLIAGSIAHVVNTSQLYMLNTSNVWREQKSDITADVYTKSQVDALLTSYATITAMQSADAALQADINSKTTEDAVYRGTWIPNSSDLNDYKTPGRYYTTHASGSASLANTPVTGAGFTLEVTTNLSSAPRNIMQKIYKISNIPTPFYIRCYISNSNTWSAWYKFEGVQV